MTNYNLEVNVAALVNQQNAADLTCWSTSVATRHSHQARLVPLHSLLHRLTFGRTLSRLGITGASSVLLSLLHRFRQWRDTVQRLGYHSSWVVLNARDIGIDPTLGPVPQNRDRLFMLSYRDDLGLPDQFPWPQPQALTRTIADVLDEDVAENFFLKPESVISFLTRNEQGDRCLYRVSDHLPTPDEVRQWVRETTKD